jgi:hypothetical protein
MPAKGAVRAGGAHAASLTRCSWLVPSYGRMQQRARAEIQHIMNVLQSGSLKYRRMTIFVAG